MPAHISFNDIKRTQAEAKKLKQDHPELGYMQRLDVATQKLFSLRHYRELEKLREKTISSNLVTGDHTATCVYCGFCFAPDLPAERKEHIVRHNNYEEAVSVLAYKPMHYAEREASKKSGYELLNADSAEQQVDGALTVVRAWYDRSLDSAIDGNYWKKHPTFEKYVAMINAQENTFSAQVESELIARHGILAGQIPSGKTYWYPRKR